MKVVRHRAFSGLILLLAALACNAAAVQSTPSPVPTIRVVTATPTERAAPPRLRIEIQ